MLNQRQIKTIPILIGCDTVEEAARQAGIARGTIYSWLKLEEFQNAVESARKKLLDRAMNKLLNVAMDAVLALEKLLTAESEAVRRAAANDILNHIQRQRELKEFEGRLAAVEQTLSELRITHH